MIMGAYIWFLMHDVTESTVPLDGMLVSLCPPPHRIVCPCNNLLVFKPGRLYCKKIIYLLLQYYYVC